MKIDRFRCRVAVRRYASLAFAAAVSMVGSLLLAEPAAAQDVLVGVLPNAAGVCPNKSTSGWYLRQDNEDSSNNNGRGGWIGGVNSDDNTNTHLCAVSSSEFSDFSEHFFNANFALLALGPDCPAGTITVDRYFDDEDTRNKTRSSVPPDSASHTSDHGTTFRLCWYFANDQDSTVAPPEAFPDLGGTYGAYGQNDLGYVLESGFVRTDDEDTDNQNRLSPVSESQKKYLDFWLETGANTRLTTIRLK